MAYRNFRSTLSDTSSVVVEFSTIRGEVVSFVVRLMLKQERGEVCVLRYDTAHGRPHLDRLDHRGRLIKKKWLLRMSFAEALCHGINDIKNNYETYIDQFIKAANKKA